jgi:hypothetical protein
MRQTLPYDGAAPQAGLPPFTLLPFAERHERSFAPRLRAYALPLLAMSYLRRGLSYGIGSIGSDGRRLQVAIFGLRQRDRRGAPARAPPAWLRP